MFSSTIAVRSTVLAAAVAAALTVAGCTDTASDTSASPTVSSSTGMSGSMPGMDHGGSSASAAPSATRTDFNDADVMFLQMMYPPITRRPSTWPSSCRADPRISRSSRWLRTSRRLKGPR